MGQYFNPGNESFKSALNSLIYVDKSGMISFTNSILNTERRKEDEFYYMQTEVVRELRDAYPDIVKEDDISLPTVLNRINEKTGESFIVDEKNGTARIPNQEIAMEFAAAVKNNEDI